jgi:hypothetical protein
MGLPQSLPLLYVFIIPIFYHSANPLLPYFQILYPIALAAAIFSMQPGAIPFDSTPKSFALAIFILIVMVYTIRLIGRHAQPRWPLLQNPISLWLKRKKLDEDIDKVSGNAFGDTFVQSSEVGFERIVDEEKNELRFNDTKACGTRAVCGQSAIGPQAGQT